MQPDNITQSTDYFINELSLITKNTNIDIRNLYEEMNIFDGIFIPSCSGNIMIRDALGLAEKLLLDGSEYIKMNIGKTKDSLLLKKTFKIYKMSERKNSNQTSETFILHFVSDEYVLSEQQRITQACKGTYSQIALDIMSQTLKINSSRIASIDKSLGQKEFIMPGLTPFDAINYCAKRAVDSAGAPDFLFFENLFGYNFTSLSSLLKNKILCELNFDVKNIGSSLKNDMLGVIKYEVLTQFDYIRNTKSGVYSGKTILFDPTTRSYAETNRTFIEEYGKVTQSNSKLPLAIDKNKLNKFNYEMTDSRVVFYPFSEGAKFSNYIKQNDPSMINKLEDTHNFVFQRKAIIEGFVNKTVRLLLPGNFSFTSGLNVKLKMPTRSIKTQESNQEDSTLKGVYTIIATRHMLKMGKHETVIDVATSSTEKPFAIQNKIIGT